MIFLKESLYGWGVCNIPQPRATQDIFAERRKRQVTAESERRLGQACVGFWAVWKSLAKRDFPMLQFLSVVVFSLSLVLLLGLSGFYLPVMEPEQNPPLEILAMVMEEPMPEPVADVPVLKPQTVVPPKPEKRVRPLPLPKPVEPPPVVKVSSPKKIVTAIPPRVVAMPVKPEENVLLSGPKTVSRQYREASPTAGPIPAGKPDGGFDIPGPQEPSIASPRVDISYGKSTESGVAVLPRRGRSSLTTGTATEVDLPSVGGVSRDFKMAHATQSLRGTGRAKVMTPASGAPDVAIPGTTGVAVNVGTSVGQNAAAVPSQLNGRGTGERFGVIGGAEDVDIPVLVGKGKASGSLGGTEPTFATPSGDGPVSGNVVFKGVEEGAYDPARMISLNQLKACIDPNAEIPLKESLAAGLDTDGRCSLRSMIFFFKYPENAYTLQVDIYNPENFVDRCDALRTALQCVNP
jgi:hypothetical protein